MAARDLRCRAGLIALALALSAPGGAAAPLGFTVPQDEPLPGFEAIAPAPQATPSPAPAAVAPAKSGAVVPPKAGAIAGRYALVRPDGPERGCILTLGDAKSGKAGFDVSLSPKCKDQGLQIFDPAGWRIVKGQLVLVARKGHNARFNQQADGSWARDDESRPLTLKRL